MKISFILLSRKKAALWIALIFMFGIQACSSKKEEVKPGQTDGTSIKISMVGITALDNQVEGARKNASAKSASLTERTKNTEEALPELTSFDGFDLMTSVEEVYTSADKKLTRSNLQASLSSTTSNEIQAATSNMVAGTRFRVILYNGGVVKYNKEIIAGTPTNLMVTGGITYKWVAFSLNETGTVPDVNSTNIIPRAVVANKDVLYASGEITPHKDHNNDLPIVFGRKTIRIDVDLNARGVFGLINNQTKISIGKGTGANFINIVKAADFNLFTGEHGAATVENKVVTGAAWETKAPYAQEVKTATFYTVDKSPIAANQLTAKVNDFKIQHDFAVMRTFQPEYYLPIDHETLTPEFGDKYHVNLNMVESGVKIKGQKTWARTSLMYWSQHFTTDKYRFTPNQSASTLPSNSTVVRDQMLWHWMSATPVRATGNTDLVDPCTLVYPYGVWRMPTRAEFSEIGNPDTRTRDDRTNVSFKWDSSTPINNVYDDHILRLKFYGYRLANGQMRWVPGAGGTNNGEMRVWTATSASTQNAYYYFGSIAGTNTWINEIRSTAGESVSTNKNQGYSIRCVRNVG